MSFGSICDATGRHHAPRADWVCCTCGFTVPLGERYLWPHLLKTEEERTQAAEVRRSLAQALAELLSTA